MHHRSFQIIIIFLRLFGDEHHFLQNLAGGRLVASSSLSRATAASSSGDYVGRSSLQRGGGVSRKLLRVSASGKDKRIVTKLSDEDLNDAWSGYASDVDVENDLRLVDHVGYKRPRTFGATGQLRIVGGVLVTQRRASREVGCRGRTARGVRSYGFTCTAVCVTYLMGASFLRGIYSLTFATRESDAHPKPSLHASCSLGPQSQRC